MNISCELSKLNQSAAGSLQEGFEETLNTDKVDRWRNSYQLTRWTGAVLLEISFLEFNSTLFS